MRLANLARVLVLSTACAAAVGSATSSNNTGAQSPELSQPQPQQGAMSEPPPSQPMEPARSLGLWKSTFGAVKIEADNSKGGIQAGAIQGIWVYQRKGEEVVGYFAGALHGNVLQFTWQEPNNPPLTGQGYVVFDASGRQYSGRWWSDHHDRVGDWNGWRSNDGAGEAVGGVGQFGQRGGYGGQGYGGAYGQQPQPQQRGYRPYRGDGYARPPQPPQQPYYPQAPQQPNPQQPQQPQQPPPQQYPQQPPAGNPYGPQQPAQPDPSTTQPPQQQQPQPYGPPRSYY